MSNSIFVPLMRMPLDISEVRDRLSSSFSEFGLPPPQIQFEPIASLPCSLIDGFILVEGTLESDQCWVSLSECGTALSGDDECSILADVKTRGNWAFAGVVAYAFCKMAGRIVFNDAGELDGRDSYTAESLREALTKLMVN